MQVRGDGGIRVGAGIDGSIIIIILGDHDPLGSGKLLFQVAGEGFLLLPSEGGGMLARPCRIQGHACGSHDNGESLLLSVCGSGSGLSCGRDIVLFHLGGGGGLFLVDEEDGGVAWHGRQDGGG
jgi:hypothetical protein